MMNSLWQICLYWSILVLTLMRFIDAKGSFSYDDQDQWYHDFPSCIGKHQSPINIKSSQSIVDESLKLTFKKYDEAYLEHNYYWVNDGHTLKLVKNNLAETHVLTGKAVSNFQYRFRQLHMHWGERNDFGSEHSVDGIKYPLEVHLVHEILEHSYYSGRNIQNRIAVIALFFVVGKEHPFFVDLVRQIHDLIIVNRNLNVLPHGDRGLIDILPNNLESYFLYDGSLTTPPCNETVRWIVMKEIQEISEDQLNSIRRTFNFNSNSRNLKQRNNRGVFTTDSSSMEKISPLPSLSTSRFSISNQTFILMIFAFVLSRFV